MRWAAVVGDLGSPFFSEERQRDVWNEASCVGFQAMLWLSLAGASVSLWVGGEPALPYACAMAFIAFAGSVITIRYARQLGVEPASRRWLSVPRLVIAAVVYVLFLGGLLRALWGAGPASVREGFVIGLGLGLVGAVAGGLWAIRAADRARPERADTDS